MAGVLILGAGQAGGQAAASLRQGGYGGDITLLGEEAHPPYQRPPLSKQYLAGQHELGKVYLRPERFYADQGIALVTGVRAETLDRQGKAVLASDGQRYGYDQLLLATGSRPRRLSIPGAELLGVHYLRTIADVDRIRAALTDARKVCIVGGGYIGLEVAAVAVAAGLETTVLEMESRILQRVTTPQMSAYYHELHSGRGVRIRVDTRVTGFAGDGKVAEVLCGDGASLATDLVIVGIGILPNVELAEAAGLACDNGVRVDEHCRVLAAESHANGGGAAGSESAGGEAASAPASSAAQGGEAASGQTAEADIFAAGDCTSHPNPILRRRLRLESVPNAMEQARVAAANILGEDKTYAAVPWFWSDQYELKLQMLGFSAEAEESIVRGDMASNQFAVFYLQAGKVIAVDAVNSPRDFMASKQLYGKAVDKAALADPSRDLKSLL